VRLTSTYHELTLSPGNDLAGYCTIEKAVTQTVDNDRFKVRERLGGPPEIAS
jgi:hypothetical protein